MKITKQNAGFTLIELLVVIAIIGILAAILFPVIGSALTKAKTVQCVQNLKQQMLGMSSYIYNNNNRFPGQGSPVRAGGTWGSPNSETYGGAVSNSNDLDSGRPLNREIKDVQVYECPLDKGGVGVSGTAFDSNGTSYLYAWSELNGIASVKSRTSSKGMLMTDDSLSFSTKKIILVDYSFKSTGSGTLDSKDAWHNPKKRGGVAAFLDGHAKFTEMEPSYSPAPSGLTDSEDQKRADRTYY